MSSACDLVAEMLLILKNIIIFNLIIRGQVLDITVQITAKFQMRHLGLYLGCSGAGIISSTMLCLLGFIYCVNYFHHIAMYLPPPLYMIPINTFRQCIPNTNIWRWVKIYYLAHVCILLALNAIESRSRKTKSACTHKLLPCIWRLPISNW